MRRRPSASLDRVTSADLANLSIASSSAGLIERWNRRDPWLKTEKAGSKEFKQGWTGCTGKRRNSGVSPFILYILSIPVNCSRRISRRDRRPQPKI